MSVALISVLILAMLQLHYEQALVPPLNLSGVLLSRGTHKVILGQSLKVIVSDGRGFRRQKVNKPYWGSAELS